MIQKKSTFIDFFLKLLRQCENKTLDNKSEKFYDHVIEIDLGLLEPYVNGPFTPDLATPISEL